ncbi:MAG: CDP-diacylglycerol O-phosphatidyltransferase [Chloroflexi bacterium]|nr:CDP-diacylglycerol O-phosphatidyltransferase [Chloroflexota bacterium]MCC6894935.1 CDP-diacylglycerol O-phosphatidyltransferase [Anaerolineae bacterium]
MPKQKIAAWLVHLYTASGGIVGMFALYWAAQGQPRHAFFLLGIAMLIDGTDGILARRVGVRRVLPNFDGAMIDNVIDVLTYVWVPVFIMASQNLLPNVIWTAVPVIAALYAYGQTNMKTDDAFFLGFPSYWNAIALYLFWLQPQPVVAVLMVVIPGILSFIPTRYLYPSKNPLFSKTNWILSLIWAALITILLVQEEPDPRLILVSLSYPIFYLVSSFYVDWAIRRGKTFATRA